MGKIAEEPRLGGPGGGPGSVSHGASDGAEDVRLEVRESVGDVLRRAREGFREDLNLVAQTLKIRYVYLKAIEDHRYEDLPGPTYAVGFVRTYAEYLGLDAFDLVRRFKEEIEGVDRRQALHFPTPAPESRVPGGAVLLLTVLLIGAAYGGWLYLSGEESQVAEQVPPIPEGLQALIPEQERADEPPPAEVAGTAPLEAVPGEDEPIASETAATEATATEAAPAAPLSVEPFPVPRVAAGGSAGSGSGSPLSGVTPQPAPGESASTEATERAPEEIAESRALPETAGAASEAVAAVPEQPPQPEDAEVLVEATPPEDEAVEGDGDAGGPQPLTFDRLLAQGQAPAQPGPVPGTSTVTLDTTLPDAGGLPAIPDAPAATQIAALANEPAPQVYGADNENARVVLRAKQDSWVQIRDEADELLLTRVLRRGDEYRVPDRAGLTLRTGNAGGIVILVDGSPLAPIGPVGSVRGDIVLDPEQLLGGTLRSN